MAKYVDSNGLLYFWQGLKTKLAAKADASSVPTKTSDLTNDSGFITSGDIPEGAAASTTTPIMDGTASVGTELAFARGDHVHPTDTSRQAKITASGLLKGNGSGTVTAAVAGTDYAAASHGTHVTFSTTAPVMDGTAAVGTATTVSRSDHVHPSDTTKLSLSGGTMTGTLTLSAAPTSNLQAATKKYVDDAIATAQSGAAMFQGSLDNQSTLSGASYKKGWYWVVGTAGTYAGEVCEVGDMVYAVEDKGSSYSASDFTAIQRNIEIASITNAEIDTILAS